MTAATLILDTDESDRLQLIELGMCRDSHVFV